MTIKLVTGCAGEAQVTSADAGALNACVMGTGKYVLDLGSKFAASVDSATSCTVGTGEALVNGRHVRLDAPVQLAIEPGSQGTRRRDLVCIRYTRAVDGIETAEMVVVRGEPTTGTPEDPAVNSGSVLSGDSVVDMPLWRLPIDGISVGAPVSVYTARGSIDSALSAAATARSRADAAASAASAAQSTANTVSARLGNRKIVTGSKVVRANGGTSIALFTDAQFRELTGHSYTGGSDVIFTMNGDAAANNVHLNDIHYVSSSKTLFQTFDRAATGNVRINYLIVCAA